MRVNVISLLLPSAVALCFVAPQTYADDWEFEVAPYLWVSGVDGEIKANGTTYDTSASFSDILDQTKYGGSAILSAAKGHWVSYAQLDFVAMEVDDIQAQRPLGDQFVTAHAVVQNVFNPDRHPVSANHYRDPRVSAFSEWSRAVA